MSKINYIVFDLDGTLLNSNKEVSTKTYNFLKELKVKWNLQYIIATGRNVKSVISLISMFDKDRIFEYFILDNGVVTLDVNSGKITEDFYISEENVRKIIKDYGSNKLVTIAFHNRRAFFANRKSDRVLQIMKINNTKEFVLVNKKVEFENPARVMLLFDTENINELSFNEYPGLSGFHPTSDIYEYIDERVSKYTALESLLNKKGDDSTSVLFFGDGENDLEIMMKSQIGIAMKNGSDKVILNSDDITKYTNDQDGIQKYLEENEHILFGRKT